MLLNPFFSDQLLNLFGAPGLSELSICGAKALPPMPDYLFSGIWNHIVGAIHPDPAVRHLDLAILRRTNAASEAYATGRSHLLHYIDGLADGEHRLRAYLAALTHFEHCLGSVWQAAELFNRMEHQALRADCKKINIYAKGEASDLERINKIYNISKHFSAAQAEETSSPIWITNAGLSSAEASVSFDELYENISALSEISRQTFVEIPKEAYARRKRSAEDTTGRSSS